MARELLVIIDLVLHFGRPALLDLLSQPATAAGPLAARLRPHRLFHPGNFLFNDHGLGVVIATPGCGRVDLKYLRSLKTLGQIVPVILHDAVYRARHTDALCSQFRGPFGIIMLLFGGMLDVGGVPPADGAGSA